MNELVKALNINIEITKELEEMKRANEILLKENIKLRECVKRFEGDNARLTQVYADVRNRYDTIVDDKSEIYSENISNAIEVYDTVINDDNSKPKPQPQPSQPIHNQPIQPQPKINAGKMRDLNMMRLRSQFANKTN